MPNILVVDKTSPVSLAVATLCGYADVDVQVYDISSDWAKKNFASSSSQVCLPFLLGKISYVHSIFCLKKYS